MTHHPRLFVPAITPFKPDLSVDTDRFVAHSRLLLADGADGLACFGTTSEANSMSVAERIDALEALRKEPDVPGLAAVFAQFDASPAR